MVFNSLNELLGANVYCIPKTDLAGANTPEGQHCDAA